MEEAVTAAVVRKTSRSGRGSRGAGRGASGCVTRAGVSLSEFSAVPTAGTGAAGLGIRGRRVCDFCDFEGLAAFSSRIFSRRALLSSDRVSILDSRVSMCFWTRSMAEGRDMHIPETILRRNERTVLYQEHPYRRASPSSDARADADARAENSQERRYGMGDRRDARPNRRPPDEFGYILDALA